VTQDISNVQLLLFLAGWVSATSSLHHRKSGEELKFTLMSGLLGNMTALGRIEALFSAILFGAAIVI